MRAVLPLPRKSVLTTAPSLRPLKAPDTASLPSFLMRMNSSLAEGVKLPNAARGRGAPRAGGGDRHGAGDVELVVVAAAVAGRGATDLGAEGRAGREGNVTGVQDAGAGARGNGTAALDRRQAGDGP